VVEARRCLTSITVEEMAAGARKVLSADGGKNGVNVG